MNLEAHFGNTKVTPSKSISIHITKKLLDVTWNGTANIYYSIEVKNTKTNEIHALIINLPGEPKGKEEGFVAVEGTITKPGSYRITLYEQKEWLPEIEQSTYSGVVPLTSIVFLVNSNTSERIIDNKIIPNIRERKYCSCVKQVAVKQDKDECLEKRKFGGKGCYNPYAVCAKSVGTTTRKCRAGYIYENMTLPELRASAKLDKLPNVNTLSRTKLIAKLNALK